MLIKRIAFRKELGKELIEFLTENEGFGGNRIEILFFINKKIADLHIDALKYFTTNTEYKHGMDICLLYREALNCGGLNGNDVVFLYSDAQQEALNELKEMDYVDFDSFDDICERDSDGTLTSEEIINKYNTRYE